MEIRISWAQIALAVVLGAVAYKNRDAIKVKLDSF